ncbi:MAG: hypothetical protein HKN22_00810, partial [Bacteroidia bacterium]|nr:hypothetical protein [Bacteroidia bacterium]
MKRILMLMLFTTAFAVSIFGQSRDTVRLKPVDISGSSISNFSVGVIQESIDPGFERTALETQLGDLLPFI